MDKMVKCTRGHTYNGAIFFSCPYCKNGGEKRNEGTPCLSDEDSVTVISQKEWKMSGGPGRDTKEEEKNRVVDLSRVTDSSIDKSYFVTGWLVCIDGPDRGHSFSLFYGYNTVGIGKQCQISLKSERNTGEQEIFYSIVYEDRKCRFYLVPEGNKTISLNGKELEREEELHSEDRICFGKYQFEFIAFCREELKWNRDDYRKH